MQMQMHRPPDCFISNHLTQQTIAVRHRTGTLFQNAVLASFADFNARIFIGPICDRNTQPLPCGAGGFERLKILRYLHFWSEFAVLKYSFCK